MELADFQQTFPTGTPVPELLRALLEYQNRSRDWYSGHFELDNWKFGDPVWFDGDRAAAEQFAVFGHGLDGSLYALWLNADETLPGAPVVFLGSEGTDCGLIAGNLDEFFSLLAVGADELGFEISWGSVVTAEPPACRLTDFRNWLSKSLGIVAPADPLAAVAAARARYPDFAAWLAAWKRSHFGL